MKTDLEINKVDLEASKEAELKNIQGFFDEVKKKKVSKMFL